MLFDALDNIELVCTSCRNFKKKTVQYKLKLVPGEIIDGFVITGYLACPNCGKTYPILDGVPRLSESVPASEALTAQYLDAQYGSINKKYWQTINTFLPGRKHLDIGCGVGRFTFKSGEQAFAVGMDLNAEHLKAAARFQRGEKITYNRRIREFAVRSEISNFKPSQYVVFLLANALDPPFMMDSFDSISILNVLDACPNPLTLLGQADAMLKTGGRLLISSPYCWDEQIRQPLETSDVSPHDYVLQLLAGKQLPELDFNYRILHEQTGILWKVRKHDCLEFRYKVDLIVAEKQ